MVSWMIQNETGQWWSPSDGWTSKAGAKVYGVTDRQSMGAEDVPKGGKWVPTDKTMKEAEEIQDIKRRAGITEQVNVQQEMEQEIADNYINGNISDVKQALHSLDSGMAAAMAIRVYLYLNDVNPQHAGGFAKVIVGAAR